MKIKTFLPFLLLATLATASLPAADTAPPRRTRVSIVGDNFYINGTPTYAGRGSDGINLQGLLLNARVVQAAFDDRNPETAGRWAYPDTKKWDPARNTAEFLAALPEWRKRGLLAISLNLQGGSPEGYSTGRQPWENSAFNPDGSLRADYLARLEKILDRADELGMAVILGYFYFGQDERLTDEAAVIRAADSATDWILRHGYRHVLVEINNECDGPYDHAILQPARVHELIVRVKDRSLDGLRLLAGTSFGGGKLPSDTVVRHSDFVLLHGNGVDSPGRLAELIRQTRQLPGWWPKPVLVTEDDHFDFGQKENNFLAALREHASWGYFDPGKNNYQDGFQSPPVNWRINTGRKQEFFGLVSKLSGQTTEPSSPAPVAAVPEPPKIVPVQKISYHGWPEAYLLANGKIEVIVVPAAGRIMQIRFAGETNGPLWENEKLAGQIGRSSKTDWMNFGGDKVWVSPQDAWPRELHRAWPPPEGLDSTPMTARIKGRALVMTSVVEPNYGVRLTRRIELSETEPSVSVESEFKKETGQPKKISIWTVTQLKDPVAVCIPVPGQTRYPSGFNLQLNQVPPSLKLTGRMLSLRRDPKQSYKIGADGSALVWVGEKSVLKIASPREANTEYPDNGSSTEVYTNPDGLPYVEMEFLSPLYPMMEGSRYATHLTYTLLRRNPAQPLEQAATLLEEEMR